MAKAAAAAPEHAKAADDQQGMDLPVIDLDIFRQSDGSGQLTEAARAECARAADALITFGALVLHDGRVTETDNEAFLDLLEDYFAQPADTLRRDERPDLGYQVGVTLENTEKPKCAADGACRAVVEALAPEERPLGFSKQGDEAGPSPDPKCRFFWQMGQRAPYATRFPALNASNVVPETPHIRERWQPVMQTWGGAMKSAVEGLAQMAAVGLGLPAQAFTDAGKYGYVLHMQCLLEPADVNIVISVASADG